MPKKLKYAGIGSRDITVEQAGFINGVSQQMDAQGHHLVTGWGRGSDQAFTSGTLISNQTIWLPWYRFNNAPTKEAAFKVIRVTKELEEVAATFHRAWATLPNESRLLMMRNVAILLGDDGTDPVDVVIYFQDPDKENWPFGGTNHALRTARHFNLPTFNIAHAIGQKALQKFLEEKTL